MRDRTRPTKWDDDDGRLTVDMIEIGRDRLLERLLAVYGNRRYEERRGENRMEAIYQVSLGTDESRAVYRAKTEGEAVQLWLEGHGYQTMEQAAETAGMSVEAFTDEIYVDTATEADLAADEMRRAEAAEALANRLFHI